MNYTFSNRDSNSITFEDPLNASSDMRIKRAVSPRVFAGTTVKNYRSEVIVHREPNLMPDCVDPCKPSVEEPVTVRLIVSGSKTQAAILKKMVDTAYAAWVENSAALTTGGLPSSSFEPTIDPTVTITP